MEKVFSLDIGILAVDSETPDPAESQFYMDGVIITKMKSQSDNINVQEFARAFGISVYNKCFFFWRYNKILKTVPASTLFLVILIFGSSLTRLVEGNKDEKRLLNVILKGYDSRSRPVEDYDSALNVTFSISLLQLIQVDEKHQIITTRVWRYMYWNDYSLKWDTKNYGNISQISIPRGQIWHPDIQLYNSASYEQVQSDVKSLVTNGGDIVEVLPMVLKSTCIMDVTWFPFDEQKCPLEFGSWTYSGKFIYIGLASTAADTSPVYIDNGEWQLLGVPGVISIRVYECCPGEPFQNISYTISLKRRSLYYFFNLLIPCALIGFLAILGFTLPPESGEKLSLGVTILFSLIVFLNTIGQSMPANSDTVPLLGTYFDCVMIMIALSVVSTIVINLNVGAVNTKQVEGRTKKLFLNWLPWILSIQTDNITNLGGASEEIYRKQWIFVAIVVDRLCLILSFTFTLVSIAVFLIFAF